MEIKFKVDEGAYLPERAYGTDAGMDVRTPEEFTIYPYGSYTVATGIYPELPPGTKLDVRSKSGLSINHDIMVGGGLVDEGFCGELMVHLHNLSGVPHGFSIGDKIAQLVLTPVYYPDIVEVSEVHGGERGANGYGSTGR